MKTQLFSGRGRGILAVLVAVAVMAIGTPCRSEVITLYPEADTKVDTQVPFPYQGGSSQLYVGYDSHPSIGWTTRSYLRFSLAGVSPVEQIVSARLNLYADAVYQGGNVDLYRSENDTWPELATNFGNQPGWSGPRLDTLFVTSAGVQSFELLRLSNWEYWMDIADGKVTLAIKTPELTSMTGVSFYSREGAITPTLVLTTRGPGEVVNHDFEDGLTGFSKSGDVTIGTDPHDPSNHAAVLRTSSPASIWQTIDAPDTLFAVEFDADFLTDTGTFTVLLGESVLLSVTAPDDIPGGVAASDRSLIGRDNLDLKFVLDGPAGVISEAVLDNIAFLLLPDPPLAIGPGETNGSVTVSFFADDTFPTPDGAAFQLQTSADALAWSDHGRLIGDLGIVYEEDVPLTNGVQFFRMTMFPNSEPSDMDLVNYGFEDPVLAEDGNTTALPGWTTSGGAGVWNPPVSVYPDSQVDGMNVAYVHEGHSLRQTLTNALETYRVYTLDAMVGKRHDITFPTYTPPDLILRAGGVELVPYESESPDPAAGTFELWVRKFRVGKEHPQLGQPLEIVLDGGTSGIVSQVNFDSVVLAIK
jgi:hypothetical protein